MINNLLRVKKLSQRVSSVDSDGLPSMASVDAEDNMSLTSLVSESSDLQRARKMYAELQAMSLESASGSTEVSYNAVRWFLCAKLSRISKIWTPTLGISTTRYALCPWTLGAA